MNLQDQAKLSKQPAFRQRVQQALADAAYKQGRRFKNAAEARAVVAAATTLPAPFALAASLMTSPDPDDKAIEQAAAKMVRELAKSDPAPEPA